MRFRSAAVERAAIFAAACRINALYMIGKAGSGHLGTTFSSMDIVAWLHLEELRLGRASAQAPIDRYFSSKGHDVPALYAVLIGIGRLPFESIDTLRRLDGLPGHPDIGTPGITANTGSLGMGISKAKGFVLANRLQGRIGRGLRPDRRRRASGGPVLGVARVGGEPRPRRDHRHRGPQQGPVRHPGGAGEQPRATWRAKLRAFGWAVARCDGHDLNDFRRALSAVRAEKGKPKIIVADTIKGKGVSFAEHTAMAPTDRLYKFHSGAPAPDVHERMADELVATANRLLREAGAAELALERVPFPERPPAGDVQRMVPVYAKTLVECAAEDPRIVALDARPGAGHRPAGVRGAVRRSLRGVRHRRAGHGLAGERPGAGRDAAGLPLVRLLPLDPPERADLQPGDREDEGGVRRLAGRAGAGRSGPLAPVGAGHRHARLGAGPGADRAVLRGRDGAGDAVCADRGARLGLPASGLDPVPDPVHVARRLRVCRGTRRRADRGRRRRA